MLLLRDSFPVFFRKLLIPCVAFFPEPVLLNQVFKVDHLWVGKQARRERGLGRKHILVLHVHTYVKQIIPLPTSGTRERKES